MLENITVYEILSFHNISFGYSWLWDIENILGSRFRPVKEPQIGTFISGDDRSTDLSLVALLVIHIYIMTAVITIIEIAGIKIT